MTVVLQQIEFESNPLNVCYSGQLLKGNAKIFFPTDTQVEGIYIKFIGNGYCEWLEVDSNAINGTVSGFEKYLDVTIDLVPSSNAAVVIVPAGNVDYPFEIQLPINLPTSYEGTYGYIRYMATLHIDLSAENIDPLIETFTIIKPLNLSNSNAYRMPLDVLKVARFNKYCLLGWFKTDDLKIYGRLPVSGYCPGQIMNLKLDVLNESGQDILMFFIDFIQEVTYNSTSGSKKTETIILEARETSGCRADRIGLQSTKINVAVPSVPPTSFHTANYICAFNYKFVVTAVTGFCHDDPTLEVPIIIGTYPISNEFYLAASIPVLETITYSNDVPPYPDTDPPTYEEALSKEMLIDKNKFIPKYPVYRKTTSYSSEDAD